MTGAAIELNNNSDNNGAGGVETPFVRTTRSSSRTSVSSGSSSHSDSSEEGEVMRDGEKETEDEKVSKLCGLELFIEACMFLHDNFFKF